MARATSKADLVRLKPADPFELIRWLARSQSDARKAVAELVQNSLDAQAREVRIERRRLRGQPSLVIWDDGQGVIPEMERREALHYLATHVGHSRKRNLTPSQRMEQVVAGQYGVGLLGFWAIGHRLELRTRVSGGQPMALDLTEDEPQARVVAIAAPVGAPPTYTEVIVFGIHEAALRMLSGRRLSDYLAAELRGQLLTRELQLRVHDGLARGIAQKDFVVEPRRFLGERLELPAQLEVPGYGVATVELYVAPPGGQAGVQLFAAGSRVADDFAELDSLDLRHQPWVETRLTGLVDFPALSVPPGTRRGVIPDQAALAFVDALKAFEPRLNELLDKLERDRDHVTAREVWRDLRRALKGFDARLPNYELLTPESGVQGGSGERAGTGSAASTAPDAEAHASDESMEAVESEEHEPQPELALGELATLAIVPSDVEIPVGTARRVRAVPSTADGQRYRGPLSIIWSAEGVAIEITATLGRALLRASSDLQPGERGRIVARAESNGVSAGAEAEVTIVPPQEHGGSRLGIPEPKLVQAPNERWRSRMVGLSWEVNEAHEDYVALRGDARAHFRYLLSLLSKEIVQRSYGQPGTEVLLERLVEVLAHAERNLRGGG